jgi:hypothetical protein
MGGIRGLAVLLFALVAVPAQAATADAVARVLAGLETNVPAGMPIAADALRDYAQRATERWESYERAIGAPLQEWARSEVEQVRGAAVFYPFSGPDFATVKRLYPDATRYILVALQRAEPPPALDKAGAADVAAFMARFAEAWRQFGRIGFFRTLDLDEEAKRPGLKAGTTAPMLAFAVRWGFRVVSVEPVRIAESGIDIEPHPGPRGESATWDSVRVTLVKDGRTALLDYVRMDLSDAALNARPEHRAWIERMAANPTVFKAASHLPQDSRFAVIRDAVMARGPSVVQDETGIEYALLATRFNVKLYGKFTKPHQLFNQERQRSLAEAYRQATDVKPLPFRVSYQRQPEANLQVAVRKQQAHR